jgi:hypothetical protein
MKFLASRASDQTYGPYRGLDPDSPLSGYMVFDVPNSIDNFAPSSGVSNLVSEKYARTQQQFPALPNIIYEEFVSLSAPYAGPPFSSGYAGAPKKRFVLRESGGFAFFGPYVMPGPFVSSLAARFGAYLESFVASSTESGTFIDTNVTPTIQLDITDTAGVVQQTMPYDQVVPIAFFPGFPFTFLIKVTNLSASRLTLSDFCLLWG